jgi:hypothetical protein
MGTARNPPSPTPSPSKDSIKKKKLDRKAKELADRYIREFNDQVGRLEDRDTQQKAFLALMYGHRRSNSCYRMTLISLRRCFASESLPLMDSSRVGEIYALIEKNKVA